MFFIIYSLLTGFLQQQINLLNNILLPVKTPYAYNRQESQPHQRQSQPHQQQSQAYEPQAKLVKQFKANEPCPQCGHQLEIRKAIRGKKIGLDYIGCRNFPQCQFYFWP